MKKTETDLWSGIGGAIDRARGYSPIVIVEREASRFRSALAEHFIGQALRSRRANGAFQAYVSVFGHPYLPAEMVSGGKRSTLVDLADGPIANLAGAELIAIDGPECMLATMPARFKRFVACCAEQTDTVMVLTESAQRLVDAGVDGALMIIGATTDQKMSGCSAGGCQLGTVIHMAALIRPCHKRRGGGDERK